ncbi:MAG TPA: response regulator [Syntrophales bacterium]|jgi:CheY-like chemotaxis protein|nr:response regulator [Syntrophales bacterium]HRT60730.1 response regulator [Syntrophales bacterium]
MERKILIVDDEAAARQVLEEMLSASGYGVVSAAGAGEALDILSREDINVIFLDLKLFGISGIELCRKIRTMKPMAVIYAVTGWAALYEIEECREAGFDDFFTKPVNLDVLLKAAADAFEKLDRWRKRY